MMSRDGGRPALCQLGRDALAPSRARHFAAARCAHLPPDTVEVVRPLTTELVTNALWHGAGDPLVDIEVTDEFVTVGVTDDGDGSVRVTEDFRWPEAGHGLRLVHALSDRWGVENARNGRTKRVGFQMGWGEPSQPRKE